MTVINISGSMPNLLINNHKRSSLRASLSASLVLALLQGGYLGPDGVCVVRCQLPLSKTQKSSQPQATRETFADDVDLLGDQQGYL